MEKKTETKRGKKNKRKEEAKVVTNEEVTNQERNRLVSE